MSPQGDNFSIAGSYVLQTAQLSAGTIQPARLFLCALFSLCDSRENQTLTDFVALPLIFFKERFQSLSLKNDY